MSENTSIQALVTLQQATGQHLTFVASKRLQQLTRARATLDLEYSDKALHDVRVAGRRLRTLLAVVELLSPKSPVANADRVLRRVARATRRLRDADVQASDVTARIGQAADDGERAALEALLNRVEARRTRRRKKALNKLNAVSLDDVQRNITSGADRCARRLIRFKDEEFADFVHGLLDPVMERALEGVPDSDDAAATEQLHKGRLAIKRLRYSLELLAPALGSSYDGLYSRIKDLQQLLGDHRDRAVLQAELEKRLALLEQRGCGFLAKGTRRALERVALERNTMFERILEILAGEERLALHDGLRKSLPSRSAPAAGPSIASVRHVDGTKAESA